MKHLQLSLLSSSWLNTLMFFWMLLLVHLALQQSNNCFACVEQERIALLDIKLTFGGNESIIDAYFGIMSWNRSDDCCSWDGVYCSPTTKHVMRLELYYSYDYTLNTSLFLPFRELQSLILSNNGFNSCIPSDCFGELEKINSLEYLDLSWNYFDSKALSSLVALSSLKALSLKSSLAETELFINGSLNVHKQSLIASELFINVSGALSKLSKLKYLDLSMNWMNGSIIPYLGGILSLKTLDLIENNIGEGLHLKACQAWLNMSRLENLYLSSNSLNERIIPCLNKASSLKTLDLSYNFMGGNFSLKACQAWPNMSRLENLYLSSNSLNERIIPCLNRASSLKTLDLSNNFMGGNFSLKEISKLNNLVELDLSWNNFIGIIPLMLEWTFLKQLFINNNEFYGTSLEGLCKIKNLEELDISYNHMKGNIPMCFAHLSSLKFFDISYNQPGPLFHSSIIKNLTMLKFASFSHNNFEGIFSIDLFSNNTKLKVLDFSRNNQLEIQTEHLGMVPSFQLNKIDLSNCILNKRSGFVPTFLSSQYMIKYINLSSVDLKGNIPLWLFKNKTKLTSINLSNNSLNGPLIFPSYKTNLLFYDVSNNRLTGEIPNNIGHVFLNIEYLKMLHNFLQGGIPSSFGNLSHLTFLDLSKNNLSSQISNYIRYLNLLMILDLSRNNFQGNRFPNNSSLSQLLVYFADSNQFIGEVSNNLCISFLSTLSFGENQLSGVIPNCIRDLGFLETFNARENNFEGNLPCELFNSSSLRYLDLSKNNFFGLIPSFVNMPNLEYLNLNGNRLTGTFPNALLGSHLIALDIGNNHFIGNIPSKMWTNVKNLKIISLKRNNFEGTLSREICKLQYLRMLDLSQNKLHGKIPSCLHYMGLNGSLWLQAKVQHGVRSSMPNEKFSFHHIIYDLLDNIVTDEIEYIEFPTKKRSDSYKGDILNYLFGLDLSENQFDGKIPKKIGEMTWLLAFNLSNNQLIGPIPATLS